MNRLGCLMKPMPMTLCGRRLAVLAAAMVLATLSPGCQSKPPVAVQGDFLKGQQLEGRVAFIEFGLVGCPLSEAGLTKMIELQKDASIPDLAFLRVEESTDRPAAEAYFAAKLPGFAVTYDSEASVARAFDATAWPTFVLVDKFGHVRYRGPLPEEEKLAEWAGTLLAEKDNPGPDASVFGVTRLAAEKLLDETRLPDLEGAAKPLRSYMGAKGLVVVFVDTNCPFSGQAIGDTASVAATLAKKDVKTVLINLGDPKRTVLDFYARQKTGTPVLYDTTDAAQKAWLVEYVPTVILLDPDGNIHYRGKAVWSELAAAVESVQKSGPGSVQFKPSGTGFG